MPRQFESYDLGELPPQRTEFDRADRQAGAELRERPRHEVRADVPLDLAALTARPVLRCVNDIVAN